MVLRPNPGWAENRGRDGLWTQALQDAEGLSPKGREEARTCHDLR